MVAIFKPSNKAFSEFSQCSTSTSRYTMFYLVAIACVQFGWLVFNVTSTQFTQMGYF